MLGDNYTIVDMAVWAGRACCRRILGKNAWRKLPKLQRLIDEIRARPAAAGANALEDRHAFKTDMDAEARRILFPQIVKSAV